jgi:hypothetical protein
MTESASIIHKDRFLDTVWARVLAALVAIGGIALFVGTNQATLFGSKTDMAGAGNGAYQQCLGERLEAVDKLAAEAGFTVKQKELAQARAAETCRNLSAAQ